MPVIDFHSHILPGMDDGSKSVEMSLDMLHAMKRDGTDIVVASSHYYGHKEPMSRFLERRSKAWESLSAVLDEDCPQIILGSEVAFFSGLMKNEDLTALCIEGTKTLLLEMPFNQWGGMETEAVTHLCLDKGYQIILAHLERFVDLQKNNHAMMDILSLPVLVQINAETLLPMLRRKRWLELFVNGDAHLLGTDSHNMTNRAPNLGQARTMIEKKCGRGVLTEIDQNGARILKERV